MSYTTDADLFNLIAARTLTQLAADDPQAEAPDPLILAEARAYADAQVDARIRHRYSLPLAETPRELRDWALALARRWLYERRPDQDIPAPVVDSAKESLFSLDSVRDGKMSLDSAVSDAASTVSGMVLVSAPARVFSRDILDLY